jgi:putative ABC transport system permease protein
MKGKKLKFKELFSLALRAFRNKPQRSILTILGMSVGIATVLLLVSLGYGLQYILIGRLMTTEDSLVTMEISYPTESNLFIKNDILDEILKYEEVEKVSPVAEFTGEMRLANNQNLLLVNEIVEQDYFKLSGYLASHGEFPTNEEDGGVVISSQTLIPMGLEDAPSALGKEVGVNVFYQDNLSGDYVETKNKNPLKISAVIEDEAMIPKVILLSRSLLEQPPFYNKALVKAKDTEVLEPLRDKLQNDGFMVSARIDLVTQARKFTNILTIILGVFGITALIVSAIGMFNTMIVGFLERIYEVGILKSIGATDQDVKRLFLVESSIMGLLGGVGGLIIGVGGGQLLNIIISLFSKQYGGESIRLFLTPWWFVGLVLIFSLFIGMFSGWWPARRAGGLSPKEAFTKN